jgi:hypothetical protein
MNGGLLPEAAQGADPKDWLRAARAITTLAGAPPGGRPLLGFRPQL